VAPYQGLLLDFGHVILLTPFELHPVVERRYRLAAGSLDWQGPFDPSTDDLWQAMQAGRLSERDYWRRRAEETERRAGRGGGLAEYMHVCFEGPEDEIIRPELIALIADATAAGLRTGILTNELELFQGREWMERISVLAAVDSMVDASVTGILKPDPQAYRLAVDGLALPPEQVLFVDDQPVNVAGAKRAGLGAFRFDVTDVAASIELIRKDLELPHRSLRVG
jgi:putative hydrolase of the HAD superfamily